MTGSKGRTEVSYEVRDQIRSTCGDSYVDVVCETKKVDPCIRLYIGAHCMCIDNSKIKKIKLGNGKLCCIEGIKLNDNATLQWKN